MLKCLLPLAALFLLTACVDTTGLSEESSRPPKGNPDAVVVVSEYADVQCPACAVAYEKISKPLLEKYGNRIRFEWKHFPLQSIHRYALEGAMSLECAADQDAFWEYMDLAFVNQGDLSPQTLVDWAEQLKLDTKLFERCLKSEIKRKTVLSDYSAGRDLGVNGTPTYFVNGQRVETGFDTISRAIEELTKGLGERL